jgi:AraC family transcriptional regulator, glycine betaine-responsive activator
MAFTAAVEPLRSANRMSGRELYRWRLFSTDGEAVAASAGIAFVPDAAIADIARCSTVLVCAGLDPHLFHDKATFSWLRQLARHGSRIGALCTGTHVLARAGLLNDYRCTIHWENLAGFAEEFPDIDVTTRLFEIDRDRLTCCGGTASLDLMLHLISGRHGHNLSAAVAEQFIHAGIHDAGDPQRLTLRRRLRVSHPKLIAVIQQMEGNLEEPLTRGELASSVGLSTRQVERLFRKYLGCAPARYYLDLRLNRARLLLSQTSMSILDVSVACGFVSASHFSKCYREHFAMTPRAERLPSPDGNEQTEAHPTH